MTTTKGRLVLALTLLVVTGLATAAAGPLFRTWRESYPIDPRGTPPTSIEEAIIYTVMVSNLAAPVVLLLKWVFDSKRFRMTFGKWIWMTESAFLLPVWSLGILKIGSEYGFGLLLIHVMAFFPLTALALMPAVWGSLRRSSLWIDVIGILTYYLIMTHISLGLMLHPPII